MNKTTTLIKTKPCRGELIEAFRGALESLENGSDEASLDIGRSEVYIDFNDAEIYFIADRKETGE